MEEQKEGIAPEEGAIAATPETEEVKSPPPETVPKEEYEKVAAELVAAKAKVADHDRIYTRLAGERDKAREKLLAAGDEVVNRKMDILAKAQEGTLDETAGSLGQQLQKLDVEYAQQRQALQGQADYQEQAQEALTSIREILSGAGFNPDATDLPPEVKEVQDAWNDAISKGASFNSVINKAVKVAANKAMVSQPDIEKIKEDIRTEILEEFKKSGLVKVDTGTPSAAGSDEEFLAQYSEGKSDDHKRAREVLAKLPKGG